MIQTREFMKLVRNTLIEDGLATPNDEVITVWYCKTIQNHKGLFIIRDCESDIIKNAYFEATYNGDKEELYIDTYLKAHKITKKKEN